MSGINRIFSGLADAFNRTEAENQFQSGSVADNQPLPPTIGADGLDYMIARHVTEPPLPPQQQEGESLRYVTSQADTIIRRASEAVDRRGRRSYNYDGLVRELVRRAEREPLVVATALRDERMAWVRPDLARDVLRGLSDEQLQRMGRRNEGRGFLQELRRHIEGEQSEARRQAAEAEDRRGFARIDEAFRIGDARRNEFRSISAEQLRDAMQIHGLSLEQARERVGLLDEGMREFGIDTPMQQAMFLAQIGQETYGLTRLGEDNQGRGHGYGEWYGRGPIQLTGERNYRAATAYFSLPLLDNKELAADPQNGFRIAGWFWTTHAGVNGLISNRPESAFNDFRRVSVRVNGTNPDTGLPNGYEERLEYFKNTLNALGVEGRERIIREIDAELARRRRR